MLERHLASDGIEGFKLLVYEHDSTGETFVVPHPNLSLENIPAIQNEVYGMLARSTGKS